MLTETELKIAVCLSLETCGDCGDMEVPPRFSKADTFAHSRVSPLPFGFYFGSIHVPFEQLPLWILMADGSDHCRLCPIRLWLAEADDRCSAIRLVVTRH